MIYPSSDGSSSSFLYYFGILLWDMLHSCALQMGLRLVFFIISGPYYEICSTHAHFSCFASLSCVEWAIVDNFTQICGIQWQSVVKTHVLLVLCQKYQRNSLIVRFEATSVTDFNKMDDQSEKLKKNGGHSQRRSWIDRSQCDSAKMDCW